jgi:deoxyribose-phosphate aldolase
MTKEEIIALAGKIDHTILKPESTNFQIENLCKEANEFNFASVCVLPHYVSYAKNLINNDFTKICTVIGFPLGATFTQTKVAEAEEAIENGAEELDMVMNIAAFKNEDYMKVQEDIETIAEFAHLNNTIVKVIIETSLLTLDEKIKASVIVSNSGADFIKTSTGFSTGGATVEDILLMREHCNSQTKIKASGGIRDLDFALELIDAGADRIGASAGVKIIEEANKRLQKN